MLINKKLEDAITDIIPLMNNGEVGSRTDQSGIQEISKHFLEHNHFLADKLSLKSTPCDQKYVRP